MKKSFIQRVSSALKKIYNGTQPVYKKTYQYLNILKNILGIYEKLIRPLYLILFKIMQWLIPIIIYWFKEF